jgi:hypothetical protein
MQQQPPPTTTTKTSSSSSYPSTSTSGVGVVRISPPKRNTISYQQNCLLQPIPISIVLGSAYTVFTTFVKYTSTKNDSSSNNTRFSRYRTSTGNPSNLFNHNNTANSITRSSILRQWSTAIGIVYIYYSVQCPMEAIQNKQSYVHNGIAAFTLSYIGLAREYISVPFIPAYSIYQLPHLTRTILGASIYSCIAMCVAAVYGRKTY